MDERKNPLRNIIRVLSGAMDEPVTLAILMQVVVK